MVNKSVVKKNKGFTLIEMLVAVAIFSIVLVISMGAILTIIDANRKAQTLSSVMNNLNFALESMTRTIKTGVDPSLSGGVLTVDAIDLTSGNFSRREVSFRLDETDGQGQIVRQVGSGSWIPITSDEVDIDQLSFSQFGDGDFNQPKTVIFIEGTVSIASNIQSVFKIQTSISQRRLDIQGEEYQ